MKQYLYKTFLFFSILAIPLCIFYYLNEEYLAAFRVTNSYSFNEKIKWLPPAQKLDILTFGSSMSLNNVSSTEIVTGFNKSSYLNASAWGLKIKEIDDLAPTFIQSYNPETLLLAANIQDFGTPSIEFDMKEIQTEIKSRSSVKVWNLLDKYYFNHTIENQTTHQTNTIYDSLKFDNYGGVPLADNNFNIIESRWNVNYQIPEFQAQDYEALLNISKYSKEQGVQFVFIQLPIRASLHNTEYFEKIAQHINTIKSLIEPNDAIVIDLSGLVYPESFFVDTTHMNQSGADQVTRRISEEYKTHMSNQ